MNQNKATQNFLDLEKKYWAAMQEHDLEAALELTDFPCIVAGPQGMQAVDQEAYTKMFNSHRESFKQLKFDEKATQVRQLSEDTAVIAYNVTFTVDKDGQQQQMKAVDTSTWINKNGRWVCAMHTETPLTEKH